MLPELRISDMALHIGEVIAESHTTISFEMEHYKLLRGYTKNLWPLIQKLPPTSWDYPFKTVELLHRYTAQYWKQFLLANVVYNKSPCYSNWQKSETQTLLYCTLYSVASSKQYEYIGMFTFSMYEYLLYIVMTSV